MNVVDGIARRNAEQAVKEGLTEVAALFHCDANWMRVAGPRFLGVLIGEKETPKFSADVIGKAFAGACEERKYLPKPADVAEMARALAPLPPMQKRHTDPTPQRKWTDAERAANIAWIDAKNAFIDEQNRDPEYAEALMTHGKGSPELAKVVDRQRAEMQAWLRH